MRRYIAITIFVVSVLIFVTVQNLVLIHGHTEALNQAYLRETAVQTDVQIAPLKIEKITMHLHKLFEDHHLESNIFQLNQNKYSTVEAYELNMELVGAYGDICNFIKALDTMKEAQLKEIEIAKANLSEEEQGYFVTIKIVFVGALR